MDMLKNNHALRNLVLASLLAEGEFNIYNTHNKHELIVPFSNQNAFYLFNYLKSNDIMDVVKVEPQKEQFKINLTSELHKLVNDWYENDKKIFKKRIGISDLTFDSIVICINLFGVRKIEGISIATNIEKNYLKTAAYCMKLVLDIDVVIGKNQLKIPDVPQLLMKTMDKLSTIDSSEMANFLTKQEKNKLITMKGEVTIE